MSRAVPEPMRVLVTGASGHVGRNLVRALLDRGRQVRVFLNGPDTGLEGLPIERVQGDVLDPESLRAAMAGVRRVFHLAARISLGGMEPLLWQVNVDGVRNTARAARLAGVERFVHFSSVHAFRFAEGEGPIDERSARCDRPTDIAYDRTKAAGERALREEIDRGLPAVIVNPTGILGPHDHGSFLGLGLLSSFRGLGVAMPRGGFDWVDVRDVVRTAIAAAERGRVGENYILSGHWADVRALSVAAAEVAGRRRRPVLLPPSIAYRIADAAEAVSAATGRPNAFTRVSLLTVEHGRPVDGSKARAELGHTARPLRSTLVDTHRWFVEAGRLRARGAGIRRLRRGALRR